MNNQPLSQASLLSRAKQGEASAIATLIGKNLSSKGVTVKINKMGGSLEVWLDAQPTPDKEAMLDYIQRGFQKLQADGIQWVIVHGRQTGFSIPAWTQIVPMKWASTSTDAETQAVVSPSDVQVLQQAPAVLSNPLPQLNTPSQSKTLLQSNAPVPLIEAWLEQGLAIVPPQLAELDASKTTQALRLLRFYLDHEESALLPLTVIKQVLTIPLEEILPVPQMPACVLGVYNYRGEILWMVDLAAQMGLKTGIDRSGATTPFVATAITLQIEDDSLGVVVPKILDIEEHLHSQIQAPAQGLLPDQWLPFVSGCLLESRGVVLDASALLHDPQLQVHSLHT